jgi:hypothetical protein
LEAETNKYCPGGYETGAISNLITWVLNFFLSVCSLAGRYDNPIPTRFLAPIDCSKIPALIFGDKKRIMTLSIHYAPMCIYSIQNYYSFTRVFY